MARPRALDALVDPQRGTYGPVLVRSLDPRLLPQHLASGAGPNSGLKLGEALALIVPPLAEERIEAY